METLTEKYEAYDIFLDECYPAVKIGYGEFQVSDILKNLDPIMYEMGFDEYLDFISE